MASFMSGMAGNVTAFNAVWTYDIYQSHIRPKAPDKHYLNVGRVTTVVGVLLSIAIAYVARGFNNIMDLLQLVFGFVNAPLFATFLLGMFWKANDRAWRFLGPGLGNVGCGDHAWNHVGRRKRRLAVSQPLHLPFQYGPGLHDCYRRLDDLLFRDDFDQSLHRPRKRTKR